MEPSWRDSFAAFLADMGLRPSPKHSVDRINNDGDYEKTNCRWATRIQQSGNRAVVRWLTFEGSTDTMAGWSRRTGIPYMRLRRRILDGWPLSRALTPRIK